MRAALDMSSLMWTCLRAGTDPEGKLVEHQGEMVQVNTAAYGYEAFINLLKLAMDDFNLQPMNLILVFEAENSLRMRTMIDNRYKSKRPPKAPEAYAEFEELKETLKRTLLSLGAIAVSQPEVEGDDMLAWLAENSEEDLVVITNDGDMSVLHGTNKYGANITTRINKRVGENPYGPFDVKLITLWKALVGDSSDTICGCPGFGKQSFIDLLGKYGEDGAHELLGLLAQGTHKPIDHLYNHCKLVKKIIDNWQDVLKSYKVALLHPEWVDTYRIGPNWEVGMVKGDIKDERLKRYAAQQVLVTASNYDEIYAHLNRQLNRTPWFSFDIETSSLPEADEWLEAQGKPNGVDPLGSKLTGFSITFGANMQYTVYVCVDHKDTDNITLTQARKMIELMFTTGKEIVIQNTSFEGTVLHETEENGVKWSEMWKDNGYNGFIPNWLDTQIEASYVNEDIARGLKFRSKYHLNYDQQTYEATTQKSGAPGTLPPGGRFVSLKMVKSEPTYSKDEEGNDVLLTAGMEYEVETRQYKMNELTGEEVFGYGADDTICTAALHSFYKLHMQLDHHWQVYLDVEIKANYQHVDNYIRGVNFSLAKMREIEAIDNATYADAWSTIRGYLMESGWAGTIPPVYTKDIAPKQIKEAYAIVNGINDSGDDDEEETEETSDEPEVKDPFMSTRVRTPSKLIALLRDMGQDIFAAQLERCLGSEEGAAKFTEYVQSKFTGEPIFKVSNKQMAKLLYEVMALPVRVYTKPTLKMRKEGRKVGNPMTNALAIEYALRDADDQKKKVLEAIKLYQMVRTRRSLYYSKYPYFIHWKTGKIHSSHNQSATNTRRASSNAPNTQQLPKHQKIEGQAARFRETFVPHKVNAVVVSMDFEQQELRVIADYSQDTNMVACFVGDNKKDMHLLTGLGIIHAQHPEFAHWTYDDVAVILADKTHEHHKLVKDARTLGKKTNFTTEYGAMAEKLAQTLLCTEEDAENYIDAKETAFPMVSEWKLGVIEDAKAVGYVRTMLGAKRHLRPHFQSGDRWIASKAERQAVNFKVQSSSAEMTKLAEGRMWERGLTFKYDAVCYGPIHDECVFSVAISDLGNFLREAHACMTQQYANMTVPVGSSISFGPSFGEQIEVGNVANDEAVTYGLAEMAKLAA